MPPRPKICSTARASVAIFRSTRRPGLAAQRARETPSPPARTIRMMWLRNLCLSAVLFSAAAPLSGAPADDPHVWPPFDEVLGLVRSNLTGLSEAEVNRRAVEALLQALHPWVKLAPANEKEAAPESRAPALARTLEFDGAFACFQVDRVTAGLAAELASARERLAASNTLQGLVLDLRFAGGEDYSEAASVADLFVADERPLLSWEGRTKRSTAKPHAWRQPLIVLINHETAAAAEALAGMLRQTERGLLIGSATAGRASMYREFPLSTGQRLRIATSRVRLGDGQELSAEGVRPDIEVTVGLDQERAFRADPYRSVRFGSLASAGADQTAGATNRPPRRRLNEADLVRMQREGADFELDDDTTTARGEDRAPRLVTDPVLARALDLLKGLAVVQKARPL